MVGVLVEFLWTEKLSEIITFQKREEKNKKVTHLKKLNIIFSSCCPWPECEGRLKTFNWLSLFHQWYLSKMIRKAKREDLMLFGREGRARKFSTFSEGNYKKFWSELRVRGGFRKMAKLPTRSSEKIKQNKKRLCQKSIEYHKSLSSKMPIMRLNVRVPNIWKFPYIWLMHQLKFSTNFGTPGQID